MSLPKLDSYHHHEMTDRLWVVMEMLDSHLTQHPVAKLNKEIQSLIEEAQNKLYQAYLISGSIETEI